MRLLIRLRALVRWLNEPMPADEGVAIGAEPTVDKTSSVDIGAEAPRLGEPTRKAAK